MTTRTYAELQHATFWEIAARRAIRLYYNGLISRAHFERVVLAYDRFMAHHSSVADARARAGVQVRAVMSVVCYDCRKPCNGACLASRAG